MKTITLTTQKELKELAKTSALTWEGLSIETDEEKQQVIDWLHEHKVDTTELVFTIIPGKLMNATYKLTGTNAYPDDLTIVSLTGIDTAPLILARFQVGGRWLDDIVANNRQRQRAM